MSIEDSIRKDDMNAAVERASAEWQSLRTRLSTVRLNTGTIGDKDGLRRAKLAAFHNLSLLKARLAEIERSYELGDIE